ncbi:hypothetical protein ACFCP7_02230 [Paenibacillus elgii]
MTGKIDNLELLLRGKALLHKLSPGDPLCRMWIEISLRLEALPPYPFRTEPNAMLGHSNYAPRCREQDARFQLRKASFLSSDLEHGFDPSYDRVEDYNQLDSVAALQGHLAVLGVRLEDFTEASNVEEYPL